MDNFGRMLGVGIANYVNIFEPERLVIGGGLVPRRAISSSTARSRRRARGPFPRLWKRMTVALAEGGADAGVIGAGLLAALEIAARARY